MRRQKRLTAAQGARVGAYMAHLEASSSALARAVCETPVNRSAEELAALQRIQVSLTAVRYAAWERGVRP